MPSEVDLLIDVALLAGVAIGFLFVAYLFRHRLRTLGAPTVFARCLLLGCFAVYASTLVVALWSRQFWLLAVSLVASYGPEMLDPAGRLGPLLVEWRHGLFVAWRPLLQLSTEPPTPDRIDVARRQLARLDRWRRPETQEFIDLWHEAIAEWANGRSNTPEGLARIPRLRQLSEELYPSGMASWVPDP